MKGSYLLILHLEAPLRQLAIGRLGAFDVAAGYYMYVGSAFGSGGLPARLGYHRRRHKTRPHWHIDYLRAHAALREAWTVAGPVRLECVWCAALSTAPEVSMPIPGFGASDTGCVTHLFYTPCRPSAHFLARIVLPDLPLEDEQLHELLLEIHLFDEMSLL